MQTSSPRPWFRLEIRRPESLTLKQRIKLQRALRLLEKAMWKVAGISPPVRRLP
ncbi:MAG: hypothetical protein ACK4PN_08480 [Allorhizobium sp.]